MKVVFKSPIIFTLGLISSFAIFFALSHLLKPHVIEAPYRPAARTRIEIKSASDVFDKNIKPPLRSEFEIKPPAIEEEIIVSKDLPATILVRHPPFMPSMAKKSGTCTFDLEVNIKGRIVSSHNLKCTDPVFVESVKLVINKWRLPIKVKNGKAIPYFIHQKIAYQLFDENGLLIPE